MYLAIFIKDNDGRVPQTGITGVLIVNADEHEVIRVFEECRHFFR